MLTAYQNAKPDEEATAEITLARQHRSVSMMKATITKNTGKYGKDDLQQLLDEMQAVVSLLQTELAAATGGLGA